MRMFARFSLLLVVLALAAGPASTALHATTLGPQLTAPSDRAAAPAHPGALWLLGLGALGAIRIKDVGSLAKKFVRNAGAAAGDYTEGVKNAGSDWQAGAAAGADNYAAGTQAAIADGRFARGVAAAGSAKYVQRASVLGAQRYPTGVAAAEGDWSKGAQPYLQAIAGMTLPPRRPKGDPGNAARSQAVASALRAMKVGK
jgi:hypothetical protein